MTDAYRQAGAHDEPPPPVPDHQARARASEVQARAHMRRLTVLTVLVLALGAYVLLPSSATLHGLGPWIIGGMLALAIVVEVVRGRAGS